MSLLTTVPVGSKTRSVSLRPSNRPNEYLLATGSWDEGFTGNTIRTFSLKFNPESMEASKTLESCQFVVQEAGCLGGFADINGLKCLSEDRLVYATRDGLIGTIVGGVRERTWNSCPAPCISLDLFDSHRIVAVHSDGNIVSGSIMESKPSSILNGLSKAIAPLRIKWAGEHEFALSTANSKVLLFDTRSSTPTGTILVRSRNQKQLAIRGLDIDPSLSPWHFLTGDDEASIRVWDQRNPSAPVAQSSNSKAPRKAISSVMLHRSLSNALISASVDGSILQHTISEDRIDESWKMAASMTPVGVNALEMLGSLTVAVQDHTSVLAWRAY